MPSNRAQFEEDKVQMALSLLKENPRMKITVACREARASYESVRRRVRGIPPSSSRGGHNKKLNGPENEALRDFLVMCTDMGKPCNINTAIAAANSILRCTGRTEECPVSRRWIKRWLRQNSQFLRTIRSKPLSIERRASHIKQEVEEHFREFKRCCGK
jgi:hypothetical protein